MKRLKYFLERLFIWKTSIIGFRTSGCQGTIKEFDFFGVIIDTEDCARTKWYAHEFYYLVKVVVSHTDRYKEGPTVKIPSWYCLKKDGVIIFED